MSEQPTPDNEKNRRSRSFGSFFIVLVVLLLVVAVVGNGTFEQKDTLSQDQFEWALNKGDVRLLEYQGNEQGTNLIRGQYLKSGKATTFEVRYADLKGREEEFRDLNSRRYEPLMSAAAFRHAVEQGTLVPKDARLLTASARTVEKSESGAKETRDTPPQTLLLVSAIARPRESSGGESLVSGTARTGTVHLEVKVSESDDLAALEGLLTARGIPVEQRSFDISPKDAGGTRWTSSSSPFTQILFLLGPWVLLFIVFVIFMRQMRSQGGAGGVMSFGRSRAQLYSKENHTNVTFDDVAGADEAKDEVRELVEFLKNPGRF
ncbi:MAG: hypothetical protein ABL998_15830, partial [Planctomycetota bacterium]